MKTARIDAYHVYGTRHTSCTYIAYRNQVVWEVVENESEDALFARAMRVAAQMGFTHYTIGLKRHKLEPANYRFRNKNGEKLVDPETYMVKTKEIIEVSLLSPPQWLCVDSIINGEPYFKGEKVYV